MKRSIFVSLLLLLATMFGVSSCQEELETIGVEKGYSVILDESADTKAYVSNDGTVSGTGTYTHGSKVSLSTTSQKIQYRKASTTTWSISTGNTYTIDAIDANYYVRPWTQYYKVTVSGGTGGGDVKAGGSCTINAPASSDPAGKTFEKWTISGTGTIKSSASRSTSITNVGSDCTVTANFKANVTATPTISIRVEFTDGYSSSQTSTMRSYRVMYKVTNGPTTAAKTYTVKGFVQGSTNSVYSQDVIVPKGANNTTEKQLYSGTAGFPAGYTCGNQYMTVTAK